MKPSDVSGPRLFFRSLWIVVLFCAFGFAASCFVVFSMNREQISAFNGSAVEHAASGENTGERKLPVASIHSPARVR